MKLHIVAEDGELWETIDLSEYDLKQQIHRSSLADDIAEHIERYDKRAGG